MSLSHPLPRVLIVDDTPSNIKVLIAMLQADHELSAATSGQQTLRLLAKGQKPDLILLDVMMPGMDGYEVCAALRSDPATRDISVIFVTAKTDADSEALALASGGVDFIHKPLNPVVVRARIRLHLERARQQRELEALNLQLQRSLAARIEVEQELAQWRAREMEFCSTIQQQLLFGTPPADLNGYSIAYHSEPSQGVDGDFYSFTQLSPTCFEVLTGDAMGKGLQAAMTAAGVKSAYDKALARLDTKRQAGLPSPAELVNAIHADITPRLIQLETFVTMTLLRFDSAAQTVTWVNAGHMPTLIAPRDGHAIISLIGGNMPLGIDESEVYEEHMHAFHAGDTLLLYSDGISEALDPDHVPYGDERVKHILELGQRSQAKPQMIMNSLRSDLADYTQLTAVTDDKTVIVIQATPLPAAPPSDRPAGDLGRSLCMSPLDD